MKNFEVTYKSFNGCYYSIDVKAANSDDAIQIVELLEDCQRVIMTWTND